MNGHSVWLWRSGLMVGLTVAGWLLQDKIERLEGTVARIEVEVRERAERLAILETIRVADREILLDLRSDVKDVKQLLVTRGVR